MRSYRSSTALSINTLPWLKPGIIAHHVGKRSILTEVVSIIKPTSSRLYNSGISSPPIHVARSRTNTSRSFTIEFPNPNKWGYRLLG
jgi:hypothetical protein